jgi:hypothetical protein
MKKLQIMMLTITSMLLCIDSLTAKDGCAKGWRNDGMGRCHIDTKKDRAHDNEVKSDDLNFIVTTLAQQSLIDQFKVLAGAGVTNITNLQIPTIPNAVISFISNDQLVQFTPAQIAIFKPEQIGALTPGQTTGLTTAQTYALTSEQVAGMRPNQIATMPGAQLNIILSKITDLQTQALTKQQLQYLSSAALATQLPRLLNHQIEWILPSQIDGLSATAISLITTDQINNMTSEQLTTLKTFLQNPSRITTTNNPNLATQLSAIADAPGKGFTGDDNPVVKNKKYQSKEGHKLADQRRKLDDASNMADVNRDSGLSRLNKKTAESLKKSDRKFRNAFGYK